MTDFLRQVGVYNTELEANSAGIGNRCFQLGGQFIVATDAAIAEAEKRANSQKHPTGVEIDPIEQLTLKLWDLFASSWQPSIPHDPTL
jgi:hypothetical protein